MKSNGDTSEIMTDDGETPTASESAGGESDMHAEPGTGPDAQSPAAGTDAPKRRRAAVWDFRARGEPFMWGLGGALAIGIIMVIGFLLLVLTNGIMTFYPQPIDVVKLRDGSVLAGEHTRSDVYRIGPEKLEELPANIREEIAKDKGPATRYLFRIGNYDLYNEDFRWVPTYNIENITNPDNMFFFERLEWGPFIGTIESLDLKGNVIPGDELSLRTLYTELDKATERREKIRYIERNQMGAVNYYLEKARLDLKKVAMKYGEDSPEHRKAKQEHDARAKELGAQYNTLSAEASAIKEENSKYHITLADIKGEKKVLKLSDIVRTYPANQLSFTDKVGVYFSRWWEFLSSEPREANTEGGVLPAIFGTFCMTVLLALAVAPFGVVAALYLREYAKQGRMVSLVRICVNNLAGVPSIVYGVFGLGFFAYMVGGTIDQLFFPERLPNPTFGTGGLLWASLTLALLTVPVVIVATEEALAAVPQSMREGSLACGASKWQTIKNIVLPRAMPGIMTGLILAMARGAEEVAPLMLVGVVKIAPELPVDGFFPFIHLERSFMHLGFHIFDVGFQSRNSEAAKPMVYVTTFLLITLVLALNATSIMIRNRLKRKFQVGHF